MVVFYWVMGILTAATFAPSAVYMLVYAFNGEEGCLRRSRTLFNWAKLFGLLGLNIAIWGHVAVALWQLF